MIGRLLIPTPEEIANAGRMAQELDAVRAARLEVGVAPVEAFSMVALLQLAWRHPDLTPDLRNEAERSGRRMQEALRVVAPFAASVLDMGWHPRKDGSQ